MMSYQYSYAHEKFSRAIYNLAIGKGDIRTRLLSIFQDELLFIGPEHLPVRARSDYASILNELQRYDEKYVGQKTILESDSRRYDHLMPTKLEATLCRIRRSTGERIARTLFNIWVLVDEESRI